jgi:hypothetical protein
MVWRSGVLVAAEFSLAVGQTEMQVISYLNGEVHEQINQILLVVFPFLLGCLRAH